LSRGSAEDLPGGSEGVPRIVETFLAFFFLDEGVLEESLTVVGVSSISFLFLFFLTFAVAGYFSTLGIDPHHDGIMLKPAIDFAEGKILFKESFLFLL
jgi:hypothetical protein